MMSEVKRYAPSMRVGHMVKDTDGLWIRAQDYDAELAREAEQKKEHSAIVESLSRSCAIITEQRDALQRSEAALREESDQFRESTIQLSDEILGLQQRLAAVEQSQPEPVAYITEDGKHLIFADRANTGDGYPLYRHPAELAALREELAKNNAEIVAMVESALRRSFNLGQVYWQQADSDSTRQQNKSDQTLETQAQHILNVVKSINELTKPTESGASA
jgi:small-conductance mechanosensitive channel